MGTGEVCRYMGNYGTRNVSKAILISGVPPCLLKAPDNPEGVDGSVFEGLKKKIVADKGYDSDAFRERIKAARSEPCIPPRVGRRAPAKYHRGFYRKRHRVENFFQRIKRRRRIGTRYEKLDITFFAFLTLAAVLDWLKPF